MKKFFILSFFFFSICLYALPVFAEINSIVFSTESQIIKPGELSGPITLVMHNISNMPEAVSETFDLVLMGASHTGMFVNSIGSTTKFSFAKGNMRRTVYYRDTTSGTYTLTAVGTGRTSKKSFSAKQTIVVGVATPPPSGSTPPQPTSTPTQTTQSSHAPEISLVALQEVVQQPTKSQPTLKHTDAAQPAPEVSTTISTDVPATPARVVLYTAPEPASQPPSSWPALFWHWLVSLF